MSLFDILWNSLSPYAFDVAKLALAVTIFKQGITLMRSKSGNVVHGSSNPYAGVFVAFIGYLLCKSIPISIGIIDTICNEIIAKM